MITVRLNAMGIRDLADLCRVKAKRGTRDRSYWLNLAETLDDATKPCERYCGHAECYIGSGDDIGPEKFRCMKSTAPAQEIKP